MAKRIFLIVLDSFGIGAEPDAPAFWAMPVPTLWALLPDTPISSGTNWPALACLIWTV